MKDMSWIYLLLFVVLPLIKQIIEKAGQKKQEKSGRAPHKRADRFPPIARKQKQQRDVISDEDSDAGWVSVREVRPAASSPSKSSSSGKDLGGGWTEVQPAPQPIVLETTDPLTNQPPHPLDVLAQLHREMNGDEYDVDEYEQDADNPYALEETILEAPNTLPYQLPGLDSSSSVGTRRSRKRWKLTRHQLRERLIWREILGPPVSLREKDPLSR